jgi:hypothetical protein
MKAYTTLVMIGAFLMSCTKPPLQYVGLAVFIFLMADAFAGWTAKSTDTQLEEE